MSEATDFAAINLRRVLVRLEHKILSSPDPRLARSRFERTKTTAVNSPSILYPYIPAT